MILPPWTRALSPIGWAAVIASVCAVAAIVWFVTADSRHRHDAAVARTEGALAASHNQSAADAIQTTVDAAKRDAATDAQTRENADEIRHAPGADAPVDPRATDAGLRGLCVRAAYRCSAQCVQLLGPVQPPASCPRR